MRPGRARWGRRVRLPAIPTATLRIDADGPRPVVPPNQVSGAAVLTHDHAAPPEPGSPPTPGGPSRRWQVTTLVAVVYLALSLLANRGAWAHGIAHSIQTSGGNDVLEEIWFLAQTPGVLLHGHNPFANDWLNAPVGVNLMDNTTMPLFGIVGWPITALFGPIATYNVLLDFAIFASALSFYFMARRFVSWWPAAFVGGLLYGFSPFTAATANGHLFLLFQAVPPLVILFVDRCVRSDSTSPWWSGAAVGLCFVAQFYVSTEAFASLVVMTCIAIVVAGGYALFRHVALDRRRLVTMAGCAAMVVALLAGYGAWMAVAGPQHITGPAQPAAAIAGVAVDPVGLVAPTVDQRITFGHSALGTSLVADRDPNWNIVFESPGENGSYVGVPLLIALIVGAVVLRRRRLALFSAVMAAVALILSMGASLHVDGHRTGVPLPFVVIAHLPLLESSVPARWIMYFWLFAALLLALLLDAVFTHVAARKRDGRRGAAAAGLLAVVVLVPLVPAWPYSAGPASVPAWFTTSAHALPAGSAAVIYPIASPSDDSAMLWQAMADMDFRMPGGFAVFADQDGSASFYGRASPLQAALAACEVGTPSSPALTAAEVQAQLQQWRARTVVVVPTVPGAACATSLFTSALGQPQQKGGVLVWPNLGSAS
jgi:hypothetical protein